MTMTSILEVLPAQLRAALRGLDWDKIQELRLRSGYPLGIKRVGEREAAHNAAHDPAHDAAGVVRAEDVAAVLAAATRQSAYSAQETLREGYLTLEGGHRVGVCGTLVLRGGEPYSMKDVTSLNIRVAHDIRIDSARLLPYLRENLLIIGVPGSGKTTLLRACIRTLSQMGQCVSVADERGEIAAFPLGSRVDVLRGCGKQAAMERLLRVMGPAWIAVDELSAEADVLALAKCSYCGVEPLAPAYSGGRWCCGRISNLRKRRSDYDKTTWDGYDRVGFRLRRVWICARSPRSAAAAERAAGGAGGDEG